MNPSKQKTARLKAGVWATLATAAIIAGLWSIPKEVIDMTGIPEAWQTVTNWPLTKPRPSEAFFILTVTCFWIIMAGCAELWKTASKNRLRYSLARPLSILPILILLNAIEHGMGLGKNWGSLPLLTLTLAGGWLAYKGFRNSSPEERKERVLLEGAFLAGLLVTFMFNRGHPDIIISGDESIWNLSHLASFSQGTTLPPDNAWLPGINDTAYYTFGHYSVGWLHRLGNLTIGESFHAGIMLAIGWACCGFAAAIWNITHGKTAATIIATAAILLGANFTPIAVLLTQKQPHPHHIKRFVGEAFPPTNPAQLTPLGKNWAERATQKWGETHQKPVPMILCKQFSQLTQSGVLMPPTMGMPLLGILLAGLSSLGKRRSNIQSHPKWAGVVIGISLVAIPVTNMWIIIPCAVITLTWLASAAAFAPRNTHNAAAGIMVGGLAAGMLLIETLKRLAISIEANTTQLKLLGSEAAPHTPTWGWMLIFGGAALWALLAIAGHQKGKLRENMIVATTTTFILLAFLECVYIDDYLSGSTERFNTSLKWNPVALILAGTTCAGLALVGNRTRFLSGVLATAITIPTIIIHANTHQNPPNNHGDWSGTGWAKLTHPKLENLLWELPENTIVMEPEPTRWHFSPKSLAMLTGNKTWVGWPAHIQLHNPKDTEGRRRKLIVDRFYQGDPQAARKVLEENMAVIVWAPSLLGMHSPSDSRPQYPPRTWESHHQILSAKFTWKEISANPKEGVWVRK